MGLRRGHAGQQRAVDQQSPHLTERDVPHQLLDIDPPITKRTAFAIWLRYLGREGDYALEARLNFGRDAHGRERSAPAHLDRPPLAPTPAPARAHTGLRSRLRRLPLAPTPAPARAHTG